MQVVGYVLSRDSIAHLVVRMRMQQLCDDMRGNKSSASGDQDTSRQILVDPTVHRSICISATILLRAMAIRKPVADHVSKHDRRVNDGSDRQ